MGRKNKVIDTTNFKPGDKCYVFKKNGDKLVRYFSYTEYDVSYFTANEKDAIAKSTNLAWMTSSTPQAWSRFKLVDSQ